MKSFYMISHKITYEVCTLWNYIKHANLMDAISLHYFHESFDENHRNTVTTFLYLLASTYLVYLKYTASVGFRRQKIPIWGLLVVSTWSPLIRTRFGLHWRVTSELKWLSSGQPASKTYIANDSTKKNATQRAQM